MYLKGINLIHCGALCVYKSPVVSKEYAVTLGVGGTVFRKDCELFMRLPWAFLLSWEVTGAFQR